MHPNDLPDLLDHWERELTILQGASSDGWRGLAYECLRLIGDLRRRFDHAAAATLERLAWEALTYDPCYVWQRWIRQQLETLAHLRNVMTRRA